MCIERRPSQPFFLPLLFKNRNPVGVKFVYSDLSMITLMFVVGQVVNENQLVSKADLNPRCMANVASSSSSASTASDANGAQEKDASSVAVAQCYYEAFVRIHVLGPLEMARAEFMPPNNTWAECAPTWNDTDGMSPGPAYRYNGKRALLLRSTHTRAYTCSKRCPVCIYR